MSACGSEGATSTSGGGEGGASTTGAGSSTSVSVGTGPLLNCSSAQDCSDGNPCTIDPCDIAVGACSHAIDPCLAGQYCEPTVGCVNAPACATTQDCTSAWMGDACKTNIVCDAATSLCTFDPLDADVDGHPPQSCGGDDCDDNDAARFPGNPEICDGKANGCFGGDEEHSPDCTLASGVGQYGMGAIAVDATSVYWAAPSAVSGGAGKGAVMKVPSGGGNPTTLASGQDPWGRIAVDATSVYWTTNWSVEFRPR